MRHVWSMSVACCVLAGAVAAQAADLPVKAVAPPAPVWSWTGFYAGVNAGAAWDRGIVDPLQLALEPVAFSDLVPRVGIVPIFIPGTVLLPAAINDTSKRTAFIGGGQAGYNRQTGHLVYGLEGDVQGTNTSGSYAATLSQTFAGITGATGTRSLTANITLERSWEASIRGRVGYAWDRLLVYGTGGVSFTNLRARTMFTAVTTLGAPLIPIPNLSNPNGTTLNSDSQTLAGGTVGAGFEYLATRHVVVGAEYRFTHYDQKSFNLGTTPAGFFQIPSTPPGPARIGLDTQQVTARISYLFGRP
jgi:outer membrane immunogenic protein